VATASTYRSPLTVTLAVWRALFLREAVNRLSRERAAWMWLLLEPVAHIGFMLLLFMTIRWRVIGGIDTAVWLMVGITAFFMFRRTAMQGMNAVGANQALFAYRQVKPVDAVLVRAGLEGFLMTLITIIIFTGAALYGFVMVPADPLAVLGVFFGMWLLGLGFGLMASVAAELVPELGRFIGLLMQPLYFLSGVIFPLAQIPQPYRGWLMLNPLAHGLEAARLSFAPHYQAVPETSIAYIYGCALVGVFLGLALHFRYSTRLATQ
jgi:capsular polysaccharide transport system permease protein